jgi:hypothetical protein
MKHPALVAFVLLLIASLACSQSAPAPAPDPNALNTSIAQTVVARQTEAVLNNPATATSTFTPEPPTLTFTPVLSATPDYTATPSIPLLTVSKDTNCRSGPGAIYERKGVLLAGETTEVYGRDTKTAYWYVRNPDVEGDFCWVWGKYATATGNIFSLMLFTPIPVPLTSFNISVAGVGSCKEMRWFDFDLVNLSDAAFKSVSVTLTDINTAAAISLTANDFVNNSGCNPPVVTESLVGGGTVRFSSPQFAYKPFGHTFNAKITICTEFQQAGTCVTLELNFKP